MRVIIHYSFSFIWVLTFFFSGKSDPGWMRLSTGTTEDLHSVHFFNPDTGYAASRRSLFKTFDGGLSWQSMAIDTNNRMYDILFISPDTGWRITNVSYGSVPTVVVLGTLDGGASWDTLEYYPYYWFQTIFFLDDQFGWMGGTKTFPYANIGSTIYSDDGGTLWSPPVTSGGAMIYSLFFYNKDVGYAAGFYFGMYGVWTYPMITKTADGGANWASSFYPPFEFGTGTLRSIFFCNTVIGWAVGDLTDTIRSGPLILKTTDGGISWDLNFLSSQLGGDTFRDVWFTNVDTGWVISNQGRILRTDNGGNRWYLQDSGVNVCLYDMFFLDANNGWIAGDDGVILRTSSGGITGVGERDDGSPTIPNAVRLYQNYPNPFNSSTWIPFFLDKPTSVSLNIYNVNGQKVVTVYRDKLLSGEVVVPFYAENLPSGIYFYMLQAGEEIFRRKMVLIK